MRGGGEIIATVDRSYTGGAGDGQGGGSAGWPCTRGRCGTFRVSIDPLSSDMQMEQVRFVSVKAECLLPSIT